MGSDLTVGRIEFVPYEGFNINKYLSETNERLRKAHVEDVMADVTMISDKDGTIKGVIINGMDLSSVCGKVKIKIDRGLTETVLHINTKNFRILRAEEQE